MIDRTRKMVFMVKEFFIFIFGIQYSVFGDRCSVFGDRCSELGVDLHGVMVWGLGFWILG